MLAGGMTTAFISLKGQMLVAVTNNAVMSGGCTGIIHIPSSVMLFT